MELYNFQKKAIQGLCNGKHIVCMDVGTGKSAVMMKWLAEQKPSKVLIITTPSKRDSGDFIKDADTWNGDKWRESLDEFEIISWHGLNKWVSEHYTKLNDWVYAFDECLPADTKVITDAGEEEIADLQVGDKVLSFNHDTKQTEYKTITRVIKKQAPQRMYRLLLNGGTAIISTDNHPHFTQDGYKETKDIKVGDTLYELHNMQKTGRVVRDDTKAKRKISQNGESILFSRVPSERDIKIQQSDIEGQTCSKMGKNFAMFNVQETDEHKNNRPQEVQSLYDNREDLLLGRMYEKGKEGWSPTSVRDEKEKRVETNMGRTSRVERWQRKLFRTAKIAMEKAKRGEQRVGDGTASIPGEMGTWVSQELQIRHRQFLPQNRNRMRWRQSQFCKGQSERQEEGEEVRGVRVESVEVLELSDIKRLGLYRDPDYVYCIDVEGNHNFFANGILTHNCQKAKAGVSSGMGKAFLKITINSLSPWAGFTATPGDNWLHFYPYFTACGFVRNKTSFMRRFAITQTFKGFPEIIGWQHEELLKKWWDEIATTPDTSQMFRELPSETHKVIEFKKPKGYDKLKRTRTTEDGEFLDTTMGLCHALREISFTKEKQQWVEDFIEGLGTGCVIFYNYIEEGNTIEEIVHKARKEAKVWRIDGSHHEIPTAETIGKYDVVLCQWQSGSEALNLQFLNYWVSITPTYSYITSTQARGRIKRIGQKHNCMFFYYLKCEGIESDVYKALKNKQTFSEENWAKKEGLE